MGTNGSKLLRVCLLPSRVISVSKGKTIIIHRSDLLSILQMKLSVMYLATSLASNFYNNNKTVTRRK